MALAPSTDRLQTWHDDGHVGVAAAVVYCVTHVPHWFSTVLSPAEVLSADFFYWNDVMPQQAHAAAP